GASGGAGDDDETWGGRGTTGPPDAFEPSSIVCRLSAGECDPAENCRGTGPACPADDKSPAGTPCTDDGNSCTTDACNGTNATCQHPAGNAGAVCRPIAGPCDVDETCDGTSSTCPPDG